MKIMICGSMTFAKEMLEIKKKLEEIGHAAEIPTDTLEMKEGKYNNDDLEADYRHCIEKDIIRTHFNMIEKNDAILVLNYEKNGTKGYVGAASLMEIGLAYYLKKKIFLLYPLPHHSQQRCAHEIKIMQPFILNGNLDLLSR